MEKALKSGLQSRLLAPFGKGSGGGCISQGQAYETDAGVVFVKVNGKAQVNEWQSDWPTFFVRHRLQAQIDLIERDYGDREARELWTQLKPKIPEMFCNLEIIPALIHGDFWAGNVAEDDSGPILFDPACFYGHSNLNLQFL